MGLAGIATYGAKKAQRRMESNKRNKEHLQEALTDPNVPDKDIIAHQLNSIEKTKNRRLIGILGGVALAAGGVGAGVYEGIKAVAPRVVTTVTVNEASAVWNSVSLEDHTAFETAKGRTSAQISSKTQLCAPNNIVVRVIFPLLAGTCTPGVLTEHAGGSESGNVEAITENSNAVKLSAIDCGKKLCVLASVNEDELGVQGVNNYWDASGPQDGRIVKILNVFGYNSNLDTREDAAETIAQKNLLHSGAGILGNPAQVADAIAQEVRDNTLTPSAELLSKVGPQGARLLKTMDRNTMYVEYQTPATVGRHIGEMLTVNTPNVLQAPNAIDSSNRTVHIPTVVGGGETINLNITTESNTSLVTIAAARNIAEIMNGVQRDGDMYAVPPSKHSS